MSFSAVGVRSEIVPENALSLERSFYLLQRNGNLNMGSLEKVNSKILKKQVQTLTNTGVFLFFLNMCIAHLIYSTALEFRI